MYANLAFIDDLTREVVGEPYLGTGWLTLLLVSGLATLALIQVIRFRSAPFTRQAPSERSRSLWLALAVLFVAASIVGVSEFRQRRNEDREATRVAAVVTDVSESLPTGPSAPAHPALTPE
jgi:hypothetical protein